MNVISSRLILAALVALVGPVALLLFDLPRLVAFALVAPFSVAAVFIAALPDDEKARLADRIRTLLEPYGPTINFPYRSELQAWQAR